MSKRNRKDIDKKSIKITDQTAKYLNRTIEKIAKNITKDELKLFETYLIEFVISPMLQNMKQEILDEIDSDNDDVTNTTQ